MKSFNGKVLFLDRSDINTDEIIPAKYLTEIDRASLKPFLLEDLKLEGFSPKKDIKGKNIIITRSNFGCGSSREHAPWALEANGINMVIAESFARIFRQNMFNCGMLAVQLSSQAMDHIFKTYASEEVYVETDLEKNVLTIKSKDTEENFPFSISEFDRDLVRTGGWVEYADKKY